MIEVTRMQRLADRIDALEHKRTDAMIGVNGLVSDVIERLETDGETPVGFNMGFVCAVSITAGCGSAACLAGHAAIQAAAEGAGLADGTIMDTARDYLGLDEYQLLALFYPSSILDPRRKYSEWEQYIPLEDFTPAMGARVLREAAAVASQGSDVSATGIRLAWAEAVDILGLPDLIDHGEAS